MFHQPHSQRCSLLQAGDVAQVLACTKPWVPTSALPKHTHLQTQYSRGETEPQKFKVISAIQLVWDQPEAHETLSEKNSNVFSPVMSLWGLLEDPRAFSHLWGLRTYHWWVVSRSAIKKKSNNGYFRIRNPIYWGWCNGSRNRLAAGSDGPSSSPGTPTGERVNFHRKSIELHRCTVAWAWAFLWKCMLINIEMQKDKNKKKFHVFLKYFWLCSIQVQYLVCQSLEGS